MNPSSAGNGALEGHRNLMTRGELISRLRNVHSYWSTPRISSHEIQELEQENLIQCRTGSVCAIRLTEQGARVKNLGVTQSPMKAPAKIDCRI
jgi:hypothetical protein